MGTSSQQREGVELVHRVDGDFRLVRDMKPSRQYLHLVYSVLKTGSLSLTQKLSRTFQKAMASSEWEDGTLFTYLTSFGPAVDVINHVAIGQVKNVDFDNAINAIYVDINVEKYRFMYNRFLLDMEHVSTRPCDKETYRRIKHFFFFVLNFLIPNAAHDALHCVMISRLDKEFNITPPSGTPALFWDEDDYPAYMSGAIRSLSLRVLGIFMLKFVVDASFFERNIRFLVPCLRGLVISQNQERLTQLPINPRDLGDANDAVAAIVMISRGFISHPLAEITLEINTRTNKRKQKTFNVVKTVLVPSEQKLKHYYELHRVQFKAKSITPSLDTDPDNETPTPPRGWKTKPI